MTGQVTKITSKAPAKINLFLHVTGRKDNGYHELQSVFRRRYRSDFGCLPYHLLMTLSTTSSVEISQRIIGN